MSQHDIVVVGAGPSGLIASFEAARRGANVLILEEDGVVGKPVHCAGLVSVKGLSLLNLHGDYIQGSAKGAILHSPSGLKIRIEARRDVAYVIDRAKFDQTLAKRAIEAGAELACRAKALKILWEKMRVAGIEVTLNGVRVEIKAKVTIDAEGARFKLLREAGLNPPKLSLLYPAAQVEVEGADVEENMVELFFGEQWAPGFFAWIIPHREGCRVGLASKVGMAKTLLERFIKKHPEASTKLRRVKVKEVSGGLLVLGGPAPRTYKEGFLAVGDAAGHVKPTTGGGVVFGGLSAKIAGEEAAMAALRGDREAFARYERRWRKIIGGELKWMSRLRTYLSSLDDRELDHLFASALKLKLEEELAIKGDMDFQALTMKKLLKAPRLAPLLFRVAMGLAIETFKTSSEVRGEDSSTAVENV